MIIITNKETDSIVAIAEKIESMGSDLQVSERGGGCFLLYRGNEDFNVYQDISVPFEIKPLYFKYTNETGFVVDENYIPYIPTDEKVKQLETELQNNKLAMAELIEQQQADNLNNQLALAEVIESIMGGGTTA